MTHDTRITIFRYFSPLFFNLFERVNKILPFPNILLLFAVKLMAQLRRTEVHS
jgi:hypothetical protein